MIGKRIYSSALAFAAGCGILANISAVHAQEAAPQPASVLTETKAPNFLIILADDLGYSDLGAFGGEIRTPNLDALAASNIRLTNFHTAPACSPTRVELLTGVDHHLAGIGAMAETIGIPARTRAIPGYAGRIRGDLPTMAEILQGRGYQTFMAGKWHLGTEPGFRPSDRGFEQTNILLSGGASHFADAFASPDTSKQSESHGGSTARQPLHFANGQPLQALPKEFYSTDYYSDRMIEFIAQRDRSKPFFAYLAYQAPHFPLHAPAEAIARYKGKYDAGPDALLLSRIKRMEKLGVISGSTAMSDIPSSMPAWNKLSAAEKRISARKMEVFAAMVDRIDENLGKLFDQLRKSGDYDNTFILFFSDNGAEGGEYSDIKMRAGGTYGQFIDKFYNNDLDNLGLQNSFAWLGNYWAHAATAPFNLVKAFSTEGGTRVPAIVKFPGRTYRGALNGQFTTVLDILPTVLELSGSADVPRPGSIPPIEGRSLTKYFLGDQPSVHTGDEVFGWELHGDRSIRKGRWKAVRTLNGNNNRGLDLSAVGNRWRLFDIVADPGETNDLSGQQPDRLKEMEAAWQAYSDRTGIQPWPDNPLEF